MGFSFNAILFDLDGTLLDTNTVHIEQQLHSAGDHRHAH
jgi:beta-phosphoglucomutase-like phosphatase (HAD superfamily)